MFEDQQNTPPNLPIGREPEDMFEKVEPAPSPSPLPKGEGGRRPGEGATQPASTMSAPDTGDIERLAEQAAGDAQIKSPIIGSKKVITILGIVVGVLVVVGVLFGILKFVRRASVPPAVPQPAIQPTQPAPFEAPEPEPSFEITPEPAGALEEASPEEAPVDSDGDGLNDSEEAEAGTDPARADTDNDGLFDGEEVRTYNTDPLNPDTDGDGFTDGNEVRNGYDPNGPGKLFTVPSQ